MPHLNRIKTEQTSAHECAHILEYIFYVLPKNRSSARNSKQNRSSKYEGGSIIYIYALTFLHHALLSVRVRCVYSKSYM